MNYVTFAHYIFRDIQLFFIIFITHQRSILDVLCERVKYDILLVNLI